VTSLITFAMHIEIHHAAERGSKLTQKLFAFTRHRARNDATININTLIQDQRQVLVKNTDCAYQIDA